MPVILMTDEERDVLMRAPQHLFEVDPGSSRRITIAWRASGTRRAGPNSLASGRFMVG